MKITATALTLAALMSFASVAGVVVRPSAKAVDKGKAISLQSSVPTVFGDWTELPDPSTQVVNPQTREMLDSLYSQVLTRIYTNKAGYRVMLSMAYGDDQRGGLAAHLPDTCYPAAGFTVGRVQDGLLATGYGPIDVRRLEMSMGQRKEPVTYWLINGNRVIKNSFDKRVEQIRLGLTGQVPDGLLFRISSIDADSQNGFNLQQQFVADMMAAVPAATRLQLAALRPVEATSSN